MKLIQVTKESLYKGIEKAVAGNRIGDIAFAIQEHTEKKHGYGVVRELVGHGLGKACMKIRRYLTMEREEPDQN